MTKTLLHGKLQPHIFDSGEFLGRRPRLSVVVNTSFSIITLNARGIRDIFKRKELFLFVKQHKSDFCFIQKSNSVPDDGILGRSQWRNDLWQAHGSEHSAGVATLKYNFPRTILLSVSDT